MPKKKPVAPAAVMSPRIFDSRAVRVPHTSEHSVAHERFQQTVRNPFPKPYVVEDILVRRLHFSHHATQSVMLVDEPDALVTDYTRKMMSFLLFNPNPRHILMIGLGGGSLAKFCYRHLPKARITAVEINRHVIAMRDEFVVPQDDDRFNVIHADGARYVEQLDESVDVILVDAFDADGIALSLSESNFYSRAAEQLTSSGVLVMNLLGQGGRYVENIQAIRPAFKRNILLVPVMSGENVLLFACKRPPPRSITQKLESSARRLQSRLQLDFPRYLRRICQGHELTAR